MHYSNTGTQPQSWQWMDKWPSRWLLTFNLCSLNRSLQYRLVWLVRAAYHTTPVLRTPSQPHILQKVSNDVSFQFLEFALNSSIFLILAGKSPKGAVMTRLVNFHCIKRIHRWPACHSSSSWHTTMSWWWFSNNNVSHGASWSSCFKWGEPRNVGICVCAALETTPVLHFS